MPMASAAMRLSRVAMMARPERLLMRFSTTSSVNSISAKPTGNVAIFATSLAPLGPLTSIVPGMPGLLKETNSRPPSSEKYRQFSTFRMISPKASVTMAR